MPKLKSKTERAPGGFQVLIPQAGMSKPFVGSFRMCEDFVRVFRKKNPFLCKKFNWTVDEREISDFVEQGEVARLSAHGWSQFLISDDAPVPAYVPAEKKTSRGFGDAVGGAVRKTGANIKLVLDLLGPTMQPVEKELAEKRAWTCAVRDDGKGCPLNQDGGFWQKLTAEAARGLKLLIEVKNDLRMETSLDLKLKSCTGCDCWNPLKVHVRLDHIVRNMNEETKLKLDKKCWVLAEQHGDAV